MSKTTKNRPPRFTATSWEGPTDPLNPLGPSVVLYATGPIPGTYAYAGPPVEPWLPGEPKTSPTIPSVTITTTPDPTRLEKAVADLGCKLDRLTQAVETLIAGLKVREAATEMLEAVRTRKRRRR